MAKAENNIFHHSQGDVEVTFYTDPLCCWSWAMGPSWKKLQLECEGFLHVQYKMGGLLPSWRHYKDATNSINRPSQMAPEWMTATHISGVATNSQLWVTNPPSSSYPACVAVKCAQLQSPAMGEVYLQLLRTAVMVQGRNIAKTAVLLDLAESFDLLDQDFDLTAFKSDLLGDRGKAAFREDLRDVNYHHIGRFPTLIIKQEDTPALMLRGYQTYADLKAAIVKE